MTAARVSVVITTFNRRDLVTEAIRSVLAQTQPVDQIIVIDDGSTDGTGAALAAAFGSQIQYVWQENAGVSAARNRGLAMASGRYLALLDSDDRWHPDKTRLQAAWLDDHPGYGMVLCDVARVDANGHPIDVLRRRKAIPADGEVLKWVLRDPALVPASIMLRREVMDSVGGFDTDLATGEDLEFHLRVAREWRVGVMELALATAMRGHDGLSASARTYSDYVLALERFVPTVQGRLTAEELNSALSLAYRRCARGLILEGRWKQAFQFARRAWTLAPNSGDRLEALRLAPIAARRLGGGLRRWRRTQ